MKQGGFFKKSMRDVPLDGKTVLVRADYNVPIKDGKIQDDYRIRASQPTLDELSRRGCKIVIISHLGRPGGQPDSRLSLSPVAEQLGTLLGQNIQFVDECIGDKVATAVKSAARGSIFLLENVRFHPGDESNDPDFAKKLAHDSQADYFVQDGFGVVHRAQASTSAITHFLPSVAGLLLEKEYHTITEVMQAPKRPLVAVLGGAKISDKIQLVERFVAIADQVIIGGAMANNFLKYRGFPVGKSLIDQNADEVVKKVYAAVAAKVGQANVDKFLLIPTDVAVGRTAETITPRTVIDRSLVSSDQMILDIGLKTMAMIDHELQGARTVIWNGTLGYAELSQFAHGSARLALYLATHPEVTSVVGGGDTTDFALNWDAKRGGSFSFVSTGGGASLELMSGKKLPGIEALIDA